MTDGLHAESRMLGDVKFHQHRGVDAAGGGALARAGGRGLPGRAVTRRMAARLGYDVEPERRELERSSATSWRTGRADAALLRPGAAVVPRPLEPGTARPTTCPPPCGSTGRLDRREPGSAPWARSCGATPCCAPPSPRRPAGRCRWSRRAARTCTAAWSTSRLCRRRGGEAEARRRVASGGGPRRSTWRAGRCCGRLLLRLAPRSTPWCSTCTTSRATAGRWACWSARWRRSTAPSSRAGRRRCRSCRSSTPTSPSGSAAAFRARCWRRSSPTGAGGSRGVPALELPTDRPRPAVQTFRGARVPVAVPDDLAAGLAALAQARAAPRLFMVLLAGFAALLAPLLRPGRLRGRHARSPTATAPRSSR